MNEIENILREQFRKYPNMEAQDAVKLLYQHCFGCEHLLKNKELALSMLKKEMDSVDVISDGDLWENIGNGYIRLNLAVAKAKGFSWEKIGEVFIRTAQIGRKADFDEAMAILKKITETGEAPFSEDDLNKHLESYNGSIVSHSESYRTLYRPSYRILDWKLAKILLGLS